VPALFMVLLAGGAVTLRWWRRESRRRAAARRRAELPEVAAELARAVRSGDTVDRALFEVRADALADDLDALRRVVDRGVSLQRALAAWAAGTGDAGIALLVGACRVARGGGATGAAALDGVARSLQDRWDAEMETASLTAQARASTAVLLALPPLGAALFAVLDPDVARVLLHTPTGWACLAVGGSLDAAAARVSRAMVRRAGVAA
jgi:tight adherence protein B